MRIFYLVAGVLSFCAALLLGLLAAIAFEPLVITTIRDYGAGHFSTSLTLFHWHLEGLSLLGVEGFILFLTAGFAMLGFYEFRVRTNAA